MNTAEALSSKLNTLDDLRNIARTMKALSSASVRQYEDAQKALGGYYRTIELGLHVVLDRFPDLAPPRQAHINPQRLAVVVFGTDYGLCGRFNQILCDHALIHLDDLGLPPEERKVLAIGGKAASCLEQAGQKVQEVLFTPGSADGITPTVASILLTIDAWKNQLGCEQVWLFYNRHAGKARYRPESQHLLPIDPNRLRQSDRVVWPGKVLPTFTMNAETLLASLVRQYLFVSLSRACAESLASEHNARLIAMQAAGKNIDEAIEETRTAHRRLRQELITAEILEVVTGYAAHPSSREPFY